jgi:hypothetical protein
MRVIVAQARDPRRKRITTMSPCRRIVTVLLATSGLLLQYPVETAGNDANPHRVPTGASLTLIVLPSNLTAAKVFGPILDRMIRTSPTFRRQSRRIGAAKELRVLLRPEQPEGRLSCYGRTVLTRRNGAVITADVHVRLTGPVADPVQAIAHELEHIVEELDGVDRGAHLGSGQVWQREDGAFETRRAIETGLRVAREVQLTADISQSPR